ncbi:T9SS type A sorting domain-containing protein [Bernardetia sp. OM2101]|uniref:T9SS type A sorting domain-containing protein n=1 Tax=Bernardetia sp. OM2101 TaxID=3344876 RepID=UPI0035D00D94
MNYSKLRLKSLLFLGLFFTLSPLYSATIYVDKAATGSSNGSSWTNAFIDLQVAINTSNFGDIIRVAEGNYNAPAISYRLKDGVDIYGGYPSATRGISVFLIEALRNIRTFPTTLTRNRIGAINPIILINNSLNSTSNLGITTLDGINIKGINCVEVNINTLPLNNIIGIRFRDCIFEGAGALNNRGEHGFLITSGVNSYITPQFTNCEFKNFNSACFKLKKRISNGLYMLNPSFRNCRFYDSSSGINIYDLINAALGGGISISIRDCMFYNLKNTTLKGTTGGALVISGHNSRIIHTRVNNSIFYNNDAVMTANFSNLSRISTGFNSCQNTFRNCTFYKNNRKRAFSLYDKDQELADWQQHPVLFLDNCISWDNINAAGKWIELDEGMHVEVENSLLEMTNANSNGQSTNSAVSLLNPHPIINRIKVNTQTIFAQNPQFVNPSLSAINLRVQGSSPVINAGYNLYSYRNEKDLGGVNLRLLDNIIDMGAYEFCEFGEGRCNPITIDPHDDHHTPMGKIAIKDNSISNQITIYPNPATNQINLKTVTPIVSIELIDTKGQLLRSWANQQQLNIRNLPKGLYILKITTTGNTQSIRFVKE